MFLWFATRVLSWIFCSSSWCHWLAMFCGCGYSWTSSIILLLTTEVLDMTCYSLENTNIDRGDSGDQYLYSVVEISGGYQLWISVVDIGGGYPIPQ